MYVNVYIYRNCGARRSRLGVSGSVPVPSSCSELQCAGTSCSELQPFIVSSAVCCSVLQGVN